MTLDTLNATVDARGGDGLLTLAACNLVTSDQVVIRRALDASTEASYREWSSCCCSGDRVVIRLIGFMTRRPGMSHSEFRDYYESRHRLIGEKYLAGGACRYLRRYLTSTQPDQDSPYDCLLEVWYPDEAAMAATSARLALPEIAAEIVADEEQLFDRSKLVFVLAEDVESVLPPVG